MFFTDDTKCALVCYIQNPLPRKLSWLSYGELQGDEDLVPQAPNSIILTGSLWKGLAGIDFTSDGDNLLITDSVFKTVRVVKNANRLWRDPKTVLHISTLRLIGNTEPLHPFSIHSGLPDPLDVMITSPSTGSLFLASLSETLESITLHRRFQSESVLKPVECLYYAENCVFITGANSDNPCVKNLLFNDGEILVSEVESNFEFPFAIVESVEGIFVSDTGKHCVYQIDAQNNSVTLAIGLHERSGEDDGPLNTAKLRSPTGLALRGRQIYIGEHPDEIQGAIRVCFSLEGLIKYQSVWNDNIPVCLE